MKINFYIPKYVVVMHNTIHMYSGVMSRRLKRNLHETVFRQMQTN